MTIYEKLALSAWGGPGSTRNHYIEKINEHDGITYGIDIITVDEHRRSLQWTPEDLTSKFNKISSKIEQIKTFLKDKLGSEMEFSVEQLTISGEQYNDEHRDSPIYKNVKEGSVSGGISLFAEKGPYNLPIPILSTIITGLDYVPCVECGFYLKTGGGMNLVGAMEVEKLFTDEEYQYSETNYYIKFTPYGRFGGSFAIKKDEYCEPIPLDFLIEAEAYSEVVGEIKYNILEDYWETEAYIAPCVLTGQILIDGSGGLDWIYYYNPSVALELFDRIEFELD